MKKVAELNAVTAAIRACDMAATSVASKARDAANVILELKRKGAPTKEEAPRLVEEAKKIMAADKYEMQHTDLFSRYITPLIICGLEAETKMARKVKTDKGETIHVESPVSELVDGNIKNAQRVAKELKEALGMSDGRATNKGTRKPRQGDGVPTGEVANVTPPGVNEGRDKCRQYLSTMLARVDGAAWIMEFMLEKGYDVVPIKPKAKAQAKAQAKA